ncbi:hypothetical protein I4F81_003875 [Pyropia yezoensis]|uniref:Uncharacterized protein n=1 Tax=Pyropia yezoensis TaxID=2788 RepID=A0ACC3BUZ7_PYRYE|nr:hypothetical protein I4F81_003875 [Neopyropia yezoensis]
MAPAPTPMTTLVLIRHGESEANLREDTHLAGRSPKSALTPKGVRQAAAVGAMLRARYGPSLSGVTAVYASPAVRAAGTATAALAAAGAPADHPITLAEELLEIDQGDWEDALREEIITPETLVRRVTGGSWDSVGRTHVSNGGAVEVGVTANEDLILLRCNDDAHVRGVV